MPSAATSLQGAKSTCSTRRSQGTASPGALVSSPVSLTAACQARRSNCSSSPSPCPLSSFSNSVSTCARRSPSSQLSRKRSLEASHVILGIGGNHERAHGSVRLTFGRYNHPEDVDAVAAALTEVIASLRVISPLGKE